MIAAEAIFGRFAPAIGQATNEHPFRLGLFGGTFDPIHYGHLLLAQTAFEHHHLDGVLLIPSGKPARKLARVSASPEERLALLNLAIAGDTRFASCRLEVDRPGISYTVDTLCTINELGGRALELFWIVGADALVDLPTWRKAEVIAQMVTVLYNRRPGTADDVLRDERLEQMFQLAAMDQPLLEISSSWLRERASQDLPLDFLTPPAVAAEIKKQGLYQNGR